MDCFFLQSAYQLLSNDRIENYFQAFLCQHNYFAMCQNRVHTHERGVIRNCRLAREAVYSLLLPWTATLAVDPAILLLNLRLILPFIFQFGYEMGAYRIPSQSC
jgi:hypothetical protein